MPVSTRSQISNQEEQQRSRSRRSNEEEEETQLSNISNNNVPLWNLHHGLKEKMRALTLLYEQQKKASSALRINNPSPKPDQDKRFSTHPSVDLLTSCKRQERKEDKEEKDSKLNNNIMRENKMPTFPTMANSTVTRNFVLTKPPLDDAKENLFIAPHKILGFTTATTAKTTVARKLSMGGTKNVQELEKMESSA
ncbi:hypothetical protein REPUB_Repub07fG0037500 [Reevesia pubescens]